MKEAILKGMLLAAAVVLAACDGKDGGTDDTAIDVPEDTSAEDVLDEQDVVEDVPGDAPDVEEIPEDAGPDCAGSYPGGPFGWKGSIHYTSTGAKVWEGDGDYLDNIRLANQDDVWTFPAEYYCTTDVDILFYDFTAMWCPPCNQAAEEENAFIEWMATHGWTVVFMSVLEEDTAGDRATAANAREWKTMHGITGDVMYDPMWIYHTAPFLDTWPEEDARGWPTFFVVNPDNMHIWDAFSGWRGSVTQEEFFTWIMESFELGAANDPGYIP